ncbi:hypothetical protein [Persicobacter psychrovividus]|uniref:Nucleotidyltransferase n=1 Tax=Persicobacter psychrovividus TaxID=387638 RepID=A0ABM7VNA9_9BACT|nr:hypothetical protein PEPS_47610 [Persicobacter psychrovividus]
MKMNKSLKSLLNDLKEVLAQFEVDFFIVGATARNLTIEGDSRRQTNDVYN